MSVDPKARPRMAPHAAPWGWAGGGLVVGWLLALVIWAPARWLAGPLAQASGGQLQLRDVQGSIWQGSARVRLSAGGDAPDAQELPTRLNWTLAPAGLGAVLSLQTDCCIAQPWRWQASVGWDGWRLQLADARTLWRAEWLRALGTPWNTVQLRGPLELQTQGWALHGAQARTRSQGELTLRAPDLASRLSTLPRLGSYALRVRGGDTPQLVVQTLDGALQLSGQGQWVGGRLRFSGQASTDAAHADALTNLLGVLGRRQGTRTQIQIG